MTADMVHRDERHIERKRDGLGEVHADEHRADEARGVGHGDGVNVLPRYPRRADRLLGEDGDGLDMAAGGDLRHDAAVDGVQIRLGKNLVGQDVPTVFHDGDRGLVAGGFKSKDLQFKRLISNSVSSAPRSRAGCRSSFCEARPARSRSPRRARWRGRFPRAPQA